jgi:hypothetical protein
MENKDKIEPKGWLWDPTHLTLDIQTSFDTGKRGVNYKSESGLFEIVDGVAVFHPGIKWDGTTAVPDGGEDYHKPGFPVSWKASLVHDQFCGELGKSREFRKLYSRRDADHYFYQLLREVKFPFAVVYYIGVRFFGGFIISKIWFKENWAKFKKLIEETYGKKEK